MKDWAIPHYDKGFKLHVPAGTVVTRHPDFAIVKVSEPDAEPYYLSLGGEKIDAADVEREEQFLRLHKRS